MIRPTVPGFGDIRNPPTQRMKRVADRYEARSAIAVATEAAGGDGQILRELATLLSSSQAATSAGSKRTNRPTLRWARVARR